MLKKISALFLALLLVTMVACNPGEGQQEEQTTEPMVTAETTLPDIVVENGDADLTPIDFVFTNDNGFISEVLEVGHYLELAPTSAMVIEEKSVTPVRQYNVPLASGRGIFVGSTHEDLVAAYGITAEYAVWATKQDGKIVTAAYDGVLGELNSLAFGYALDANGAWNRLPAADLATILSYDHSYDSETVLYLFSVYFDEKGVAQSIGVDYATYADLLTSVGA